MGTAIVTTCATILVKELTHFAIDQIRNHIRRKQMENPDIEHNIESKTK